MSVVYRPASKLSEMEQILGLQKQNLPGALTAEQREKEGFVTLRYTVDRLVKMHKRCPQIIAMEDGLLVGYALCLHPGLKDLMPDLSPLFRLLESLSYPEDGYRIMGQICIREGYRGQGHFPGLYNHLKECTAPLPIITEISLLNKRSLQAHYRIGFSKLARRTGAGQPWEVVIWE